ncbi:MAG: M15 family metallopeptidase [Acutalibacter sp.]|jgi:D-alanyl-D-alanine carboxypeptidase|uniref:M15 family metallopeptidase n=1 Tax=Acutalibacter sp. TaxID=1918636 RepID=UPI0021718839|nr:M15 family metallopeptidase [Acutalibacter sp.]
MTEKTMGRRRRYRQRHKRNMTAALVTVAFILAAVMLIAIVACLDYVNRIMPEEMLRGPEPMEVGRDRAPVNTAPQEPYEDGTEWNLRLVNRWNPVPEGYTIRLKELAGGEKVDERVYAPLTEMLEAAREGNLDELPRVISGYRTQEVQQGLYDDEVNKYKSQGYSEEEARAEAGRWVALPGTSEHQLGLAVDLEGATYDVFLWLQENSYKYGFIFRYPGSKTDITGTVEEVWHYRYVGVQAATEMYEQGLCLEEYVELKAGAEA